MSTSAASWAALCLLKSSKGALKKTARAGASTRSSRASTRVKNTASAPTRLRTNASDVLSIPVAPAPVTHEEDGGGKLMCNRGVDIQRKINVGFKPVSRGNGGKIVPGAWFISASFSQRKCLYLRM